MIRWNKHLWFLPPMHGPLSSTLNIPQHYLFLLFSRTKVHYLNRCIRLLITNGSYKLYNVFFLLINIIKKKRNSILSWSLKLRHGSVLNKNTMTIASPFAITENMWSSWCKKLMEISRFPKVERNVSNTARNLLSHQP